MTINAEVVYEVLRFAVAELAQVKGRNKQQGNVGELTVTLPSGKAYSVTVEAKG